MSWANEESSSVDTAKWENIWAKFIADKEALQSARRTFDELAMGEFADRCQSQDEVRSQGGGSYIVTHPENVAYLRDQIPQLPHQQPLSHLWGMPIQTDQSMPVYAKTGRLVVDGDSLDPADIDSVVGGGRFWSYTAEDAELLVYMGVAEWEEQRLFWQVPEMPGISVALKSWMDDTMEQFNRNLERSIFRGLEVPATILDSRGYIPMAPIW